MFIRDLIKSSPLFTSKDIKKGNQFLIKKNRFDPYVLHISDVVGNIVRYETADVDGTVTNHGHHPTNRAPDGNKHITVVLSILNDSNSEVKKLGMLSKVHLNYS